MLSLANLARLAPWIALAALVAWFWWRGERIDALEAEKAAIQQRLDVIETQAEQMRQAITERMATLEAIEEKADETADIIERSFANTSAPRADYLPGDVYRRLQEQAATDTP